MESSSYDVKIWETRKMQRKKGATYNVRWKVGTEAQSKTFPTKALADSYRSELRSAVNRGEAFSLASGTPVSWDKKEEVSWYAFVCAYLDEHWKNVSANHRKDRARILTDATEALWKKEAGKPNGDLLRTALQRWSYNTEHRDSECPPEIEATIHWIEQNTVDLRALESPSVVRAVLARVSQKKDGTPVAAASAVKAKRVLSHALDHAVECGYLQDNPLSRVKWKAPRVNRELDRTSVPNPHQVRSLVDAIAAQKPSGPRLKAFFSTLYLTGLRPEEAVNLKWRDVHLQRRSWDTQDQKWCDPAPSEDWGDIVVREVAPDVGKRWTDSGRQRDRRQPKGRAENETRPVPCPPQLSRILRQHRDEFGEGPDGLVFFGIHGHQLATCVYRLAWNRARREVFTESQQEGPLARVPYDLRRACVSTWLNEGISPAQVAAWAGHSQEVLLRVYAKCIDGNEERDKRRGASGFEGF
ncbi:tyrosine-type recombinase/integrase [Nocardiopsis dassonvillei]